MKKLLDIVEVQWNSWMIFDIGIYELSRIPLLCYLMTIIKQILKYHITNFYDNEYYNVNFKL